MAENIFYVTLNPLFVAVAGRSLPGHVTPLKLLGLLKVLNASLSTLRRDKIAAPEIAKLMIKLNKVRAILL